MGRYANTAVGELKLTIPVAHALCATIGEERGRDAIVVLTRAEVQALISNLNQGTTLVFQFKAFDKGLDIDTRRWYVSHLNSIPRRVRYLEDWLRLGEDSIVFG